MGNGVIFSNKVYNALKFIALVVLPGLATLYLTLGDLWDFPEPQKVAASLGAVATFLGLLLQISTAQYNRSEAKYDGVVELEQDAGGQTHLFVRQFEGRNHVLDLTQRKELLFKVEA